MYPQSMYQNPNQINPYDQSTTLMSLLNEARYSEWVCTEHLEETNKKRIEQLIKVTKEVVSRENDLAQICRGIRDQMKT